VATIQANAHPRRIGAWFDWSLIFVVAAAALWIPKSKATLLAIAVIVLEVLFVAGAFFIYRSSGTILPGVLPLGLAVWILILRVVARKAQKVIAF
jgi:hypothetical protein